MKALVFLYLLAFGFWTLGATADHMDGEETESPHGDQGDYHQQYQGLSFDYYSSTCPQAETLIAETLKDIVSKDIRVPARMIRMHFHDCFVRGCDGSILLDSTPGNKAEKDAPPNNPSLQGFEVIDKLKAVLENNCPGVVSCADILAYAARESVYLAGVDRYRIRGGRKDGRVSKDTDALANLLPPFAQVSTLIQGYAAKGLSVQDMVTLSGAHTVGVSHCSSIVGRQANFSNTGKPDPTLDPHLASVLRVECQSNNGSDNIVVMDRFTPLVLDNKYYVGLLQNKGLFTSDQTLLTIEVTRNEVMENAYKPGVWEQKFIASMIKMGEIEVLTGNQGEVRKVCSRVN
ncbi:PREDICTED: peroxidase 5-like [Nelumbo nucifera]|uniref:Peroxidase n=2 Tax=Nelumbo nucifera TaxID=4432 RepID=A0A1U7ZZM0_NELNU|nr:PREDICTED: peroxidase 5-like [Nelumbo nucifera]DAD40803.1 TPA_asm: hypothetical protein HUJ06_015126 [Nelumbo nucifera]